MNLMLLLDYAKTYEDNGYIGLSGFIRFIDRLERSGGDLAGATGVSADANVVRIMSIHKSKGLEFPVCIVAGCATRFNRTDEKKNLIVRLFGKTHLLKIFFPSLYTASMAPCSRR